MQLGGSILPEYAAVTIPKILLRAKILLKARTHIFGRFLVDIWSILRARVLVFLVLIFPGTQCTLYADLQSHLDTCAPSLSVNILSLDIRMLSNLCTESQ